jgi:DNA-binding CsgD family transcriptional regulator
MLQWEGLPPHSEHAFSQHHGESCSSLDRQPEFVFPAVVSDSQGKAAVTVTPRKPFWRWWNRPHFLVLHWSATAALDPMAYGEVDPPLELRPADAPPIEAVANQPTAARLDTHPTPTALFRDPALHGPALTARECEVLGLIASGCTNREVAEVLVITMNTVERHVTNLYTKINARNRADATTYALQHGIIPLPHARS